MTVGRPVYPHFADSHGEFERARTARGGARRRNSRVLRQPAPRAGGVALYTGARSFQAEIKSGA